jgi:hypothetical protein
MVHYKPAALRQPWLSQQPASPPFRDSQFLLHAANLLPASSGTQYFSFMASSRIALSISCVPFYSLRQR